jgi:hypothetical protein
MRWPRLRTWILMISLIALSSLAIAHWRWDAKSREYTKIADSYKAQARDALTVVVDLEGHVRAFRNAVDGFRQSCEREKRILVETKAVLAGHQLPGDEVDEVRTRRRERARLDEHRIPEIEKMIAEREVMIAGHEGSLALMEQELRYAREHPDEQKEKAANARAMATAYERAARYPWLGAPPRESGHK